MSIGHVLLVLDALWCVAWVIVMFIIQLAYDCATGADYRGVHRGQILHVATISVMSWMAAKKHSSWLTIAFYVFWLFADLSTLLDIILHLSRDAIPVAWNLEIALASWAVAVTFSGAVYSAVLYFSQPQQHLILLQPFKK